MGLLMYVYFQIRYCASLMMPPLWVETLAHVITFHIILNDIQIVF
jgi:hypothetical protein